MKYLESGYSDVGGCGSWAPAAGPFRSVSYVLLRFCVRCIVVDPVVSCDQLSFLWQRRFRPNLRPPARDFHDSAHARTVSPGPRNPSQRFSPELIRLGINSVVFAVVGCRKTSSSSNDSFQNRLLSPAERLPATPSDVEAPPPHRPEFIGRLIKCGRRTSVGSGSSRCKQEPIIEGRKSC